jgi:hypothetical protein
MTIKQLRNIIREEIESQLPKQIGFKGKTDYSGGFKREFSKFFDMPEGSNQPAGIFMELADLVTSRFEELKPLIDSIGRSASEIYDYLVPKTGHLTPYDINRPAVPGANQTMWEDMENINRMGKALIQNLDNVTLRGGEKMDKVLQSMNLKLEIIKEIFEGNFKDQPKRSPIGF